MVYDGISEDKGLQKNDSRKILLQMLVTTQNVLDLSNQLRDKVQLGNIIDTSVNIESSGTTTKTQSSKSGSSSATVQDRNYNDLLVNTFLQEMLSYPLTYPNLFSDLKHNSDKNWVNGIVSSEATKVVGESLFIPIVNVLLKLIDDVASLSEQDEDNIVRVLMDYGRGQPNMKDMNIIMKSGGMGDIYEELSKLVDNRGVDIGTLDSIRKTWMNIFNSAKGRPMFIDYITTVLPTIESRVETSKFTPSMEDYRVEESSKVAQFLGSVLTDKILQDLQTLAKSPYSNTLLAFFRNLSTSYSDGKMQTGLINLYYIIWWALTNDNLLSTLYLKSVGGKPPDPAIKPALMFQGSLFQNSQNSNGRSTLQSSVKYFQEINNSINEEIKKPGGLTTVLNRLVGVRI